MDTIGNPWLWGGFFLVVVLALLADLVLMRHGGPHKVTFREALCWSVGWVALALAVQRRPVVVPAVETAGAAVGNRVGLEFLTGYLVEKSLAVDNIFVFLMLFTYFAVPEEQRQRVLVIGVLRRDRAARDHDLRRRGADRAVPLDPLRVRRVPAADRHQDAVGRRQGAGPGQEPAAALDHGHLPLIRRLPRRGAVASARRRRRKYTPLFVVLVMIGVTDVIFAVDSIPAIFAITTDPFIVLTSNVFAVLGLRAMFFLLAGMAERFHLLPYGLALVLMFIGTKMLLVDVYKIPVLWSLGVVAAIIGATVVLSLKRPPVQQT